MTIYPSWTDQAIGVTGQPDGRRVLSRRSFEKQEFKTLVLGPASPPGTYTVEDCTFRNCKVTGGRFVVRDGVILKNVAFENVTSSDPFTIYTSALCNGVTVSNTSTRSYLWIKPPESVDDQEYRDSLIAWIDEVRDSVEVMVDISAFHGEVSIYGLPARKVVVDPENHVVFRRNWEGMLNWRSLGLRRTSPWVTSLSRLDDCDFCGTPEGIFDIQSRQKRDTESELMKELDMLRDLGIAE